MDVEIAKVELDAAKGNYSAINQITNLGARTEVDRATARSKIEVAAIELERAKEILKSFQELERIEPYLNPESVEK
jgi:hypothetical protein